MTTPSYGTLFSCIAAGLLCLVFVRALLHKLSGFAEFVTTVRDYRLVTHSRAAALAIVGAEIVVTVGLLVPQTRGVAAIGAAILLGLYAGAIAINLRRGRTSIDCGCGGGGQGISRLHVVRNLILMSLSVPVMLFDSAIVPQLGLSLAVIGCVLVLWLTFLAFDQLLGNRTHAIATTYSTF